MVAMALLGGSCRQNLDGPIKLPHSTNLPAFRRCQFSSLLHSGETPLSPCA
ncbi:hypothetical protein SLEP1_g5415 [Rubroshorea leprosula]|uniref:Uncharacterized protein n=1 Tax=Rubroshorea leprosula TaxID=152421 RepID=A0AAV5I2P1_9ROSI|nr:hypothetical protein SLEP1_g5415 [Rubroshorea leprosula]